MNPSLSLVLVIADIPTRVVVPDKKTFSIVVRRYADYIAKKKHHTYTIWLDGAKKKPYKRRGDFHISRDLIHHNFLAFNDSLRMVIVHILNQNRGLIVHASSLVANRRGYVFMGKEGAGKSTVRTLHRSLTSLGDDSAIIRLVGKKLYLYGSPFYQRTKRAYPNKKVPIIGIYSLRQSSGLMVETLPFPINYQTLLARCYISHIGQKKSEMTQLTRTCLQISEQKKIFSLHFPKTYQFISLLNNPILNKTEIAKRIKLVNQKVSVLLPAKVSWHPAVVDLHFLKMCQVIKEASWEFEYSKERQVARIASRIKHKKINGPHTNLIHEKMGRLKKSYFITCQTPSGYVLLDKNHEAIATVLHTKKNQTFPMIIGQTSSQSDQKFKSIL